MTKRAASIRLLSTITLLSTASVYAGGFALIEQGGSGMGNSYAGAAAVSGDASTVWFNPAGMLELDGAEFSMAGHLIAVGSDFSDEGTSFSAVFGAAPVDEAGNSSIDSGGNSFVPNLYYVRPFKKDLAFGIGLSVPFGNSTEYDRDWVGRYQAVESGVTVLDINPSIAYRVNDKFSIGGGISVQLMDATLGNSVDSGATCQLLVLQNPAAEAGCTAAALGPDSEGIRDRDGYAEITGDSTDVTFNLGMLFKPTTATKLGVAYRHSIDHTLEGKAEFETDPGLQAFITQANLGLFQNGGATAIANLPSSLMFSGAHTLNDKVQLLADATWTGWSSFEELRITFDNENQPDTFNRQEYEDVWRLSAGVNYQHNEKLTLRAGAAYDQDPVPSPQLRTARIPGNDRTWISFGAGYKVSKNVSFDVGYAHLFVDETPIDNSSDSTGGTTIRGVYDVNVNLLSAQFNWNFN